MLGAALFMAIPVWANQVEVVPTNAAAQTRWLEAKVSDDPKRALAEAETWMREAEKNNDKALLLRALRLMVYAHDQVEDSPRVKQAIVRAMVIAKEVGDEEVIVDMMGSEAALAQDDGRMVEASELYQRAIEFAEAKKLPDQRYRLIIGRANLYSMLGRRAEALTLLTEAEQYFKTAGETENRMVLSSIYSAMSTAIGAEQKDVVSRAKAMELDRRAIAMLDPKRNRSDLSTSYYNMGVNHIRNKDYSQARDYLDRSRSISRELNDESANAYVDYQLAILDLVDKHPREAAERLRLALPVFKARENMRMLLRVNLSRADALSQMGQKRESFAHLAEARQFVGRVNTPSEEVNYFETSGAIYARLGDFAAAYRESQALHEAERRARDIANEQLSAEFASRADVRQKEAENAMLRARERESEARKIALLLAILLLLLVLSALTVYSVRQVRSSRRLATLAMRDELTGLPNRRSIMESARLQLRMHQLSGAPFCVALVDLDYFKSVNDQYGHATGDAALVAFAEVCQRELRTNDHVGRLGGEEFLIVMPATDVNQAEILYARLRAAVVNMRVVGLPETRKITFSMGVAAAKSIADDAQSMVKAADTALYRGKAEGRDRFVIA